MSDQHTEGSDQHTQEGQVQRAKRLREQIENLKSGRPSGPPKSLREQIEERAGQIHDQDEPREP